jgi:hypothetical protein
MESGGKFFPVCTEEFATAVFVQEFGSSEILTVQIPERCWRRKAAENAASGALGQSALSGGLRYFAGPVTGCAFFRSWLVEENRLAFHFSPQSVTSFAANALVSPC